jgi:hypothetical protein
MGGQREPIRDAPGADAAAYQKVIDSGDPDRASQAANDLGWHLAKQGDVTAARAAYQVAIDSGHRDYAPRARRYCSRNSWSSTPRTPWS